MVCCSSAAPRRVVFVGIDGAGKTTLVQRLRLGRAVTPLPTIGCQEIALASADFGPLLLVDLPGENMLRPLWRHHFDDVSGIALVLNTADSDERLAQATDELHKVLSAFELAHVPLVVFANKQDLAGARDADAVRERLAVDGATRAWKVVPCTATTGAGVQEGLTWLLKEAAPAKNAATAAGEQATPAPSSFLGQRATTRVGASGHAGFSPVMTDPLKTCFSPVTTDLEAPVAAAEEGGDDWRMPIVELFKFRTDDATLDGLGSAAAREFYEEQNAAIDSFEELEALRGAVLAAGSATAAALGSTDAATDAANSSAVALAVNASLATNVAILAAKAAVVALSGSLVMIASLIDSVLDLMSGATLVLTERLVAKDEAYKYPLGKKTFAPLGTLIFSVVMFTACFQVLQEAAMTLVALGDHEIAFGWTEIIIVLVVIAVKGGLFAYCRKHARLSPSVEAPMDDHRNDVISNGVGMVLAKLGARFWVGLDPLGAILVTLYIMHVWFGSALEQVRRTTVVSSCRHSEKGVARGGGALRGAAEWS